jgi:Cu(I)/Ag(I) efflux system membrane protein CusA/SilA
MITRLIHWSLHNRPTVLLAALLLALIGIWSAATIRLDAIPDLSDTQVIIKTNWPGQSPQQVENQVTYPLAATLLSVPNSTAVRGFSMFGESYLYVLFEDGTDPYWARSRVLEYLNQASARLPAGVTPQLGPDASGTGWVFEYALVDNNHRYDADQLRAVQDFYLKYELQSVAGVAEVASVGGMVRQFQIEIDPNRLAAYRITPQQIAQAVNDSNQSGGGSVVELGRSEFMVKADGYLKTLEDFRDIPVALDEQGLPVRLQDVAHIQLGPEARRGVTDLDGEGEVTGGIVVMRQSGNALDTVERVKQRLDELRAGLPEGVELVVTYDRSHLIRAAVNTLWMKLLEESLVVALVCLLFLFHFRSALVAIATLPLGILAAFALMKMQGISANLMSLGGIAIAIGTMVDAAVVMIENMHKHLEQNHPLPHPSPVNGRGALIFSSAEESEVVPSPTRGRGVGERVEVSSKDYWQAAKQSATEVGPALFFSLLIITVSFLPVLTLTGQEQKLFSPLAWTKTYAMAASALLAITVMPVLMGYFIRGRIVAENKNPLNRVLQKLYRPLLNLALRHRKTTLSIALLVLLSSLYPALRMGSEFMPPLYEGDLLYMPTTLPGVSIGEAANILQITDRLIKQMPEVERVFGKAGRADTATDPAPLSMLETTILLKPREQWPDGETVEQFIAKLNRELNLPGLTNSWGYPIRTRIDMLSTGIRTPLGVKITGPDLQGIAQLAADIEHTLQDIPGTRNVFAERVTGGRYLNIDIDRRAAARYGITPADVQNLAQGAIGGETIGTVINGRERYSIALRYPRDFRDSLQRIRESRVTTPGGESVPLGELAQLHLTDGPAEIKSENARLVGFLYLDIAERDLGSYVQAAQAAIAQSVKIPAGYAVQWSGQYANLQHAKQRMAFVVPLTLLLVMLLLYLHFREIGRVLLVLLCLPFSLAGGAWLVYWLGYPMSVAVAVGFIALAGVAAEFGVVMLLYLDKAVDAMRMEGRPLTASALTEAVIHGAAQRLRPKMMTVSVIIVGLLPVMFSDAIGADVMKRIAAPLVGGMVTAPLLSLLVIPVIYLWRESRRVG